MSVPEIEMSSSLKNENAVVQVEDIARPSFPEVDLFDAGEGPRLKGILKSRTGDEEGPEIAEVRVESIEAEGRPEKKRVVFREQTKDDIRYYRPEKRKNKRVGDGFYVNETVATIAAVIIIAILFITVVIFIQVIQQKDQDVIVIVLLIFLIVFCIILCFILWKTVKVCNHTDRKNRQCKSYFV